MESESGLINQSWSYSVTSYDAVCGDRNYITLPGCLRHGWAVRLVHALRCDGRSPLRSRQFRIRDCLMHHNPDTGIRPALVLTVADTCTRGCPLCWRGSVTSAICRNTHDCRRDAWLLINRTCAGTIRFRNRYNSLHHHSRGCAGHIPYRSALVW